MNAASPEPDYQSACYAIGLARQAPAFTYFAVDSLGQGALRQNPVLDEPAVLTDISLEMAAPGEFLYRRTEGGRHAAPLWRIKCEEKTFTLHSELVSDTQAPPLVLTFAQKANHATLLGLMEPGDRRMSLPCVLHLPDRGSARITSSMPGLKLDYDARRQPPAHDARRPMVPTPFVRIAFPPASATQPRVEYRFEVTAIFPQWRGVEEARFAGFRRNYLNLFQVNPRVQMLANNASSDPVAFTVFKFAEMARCAPPLADGLTCLDLVRMTLDRYLSGAKGYGQAGYACTPGDADLCPWTTPWTSLDSLPSLVLAACVYLDATQDWPWGLRNYTALARWAREMMSSDQDGDGLLEYPGTGNYGDRPTADRRPSNWWDTINFGHKDAYANALAYQACRKFAGLADKLGRADDRAWFADKARQLRAAYVPAFLNPATGVLAGWRSADGQSHDYWFTFVQGAAITYGLVDDPLANAIMDRLLAKLPEVGFTDFSLGLPGNLIPIRRGDYVDHDSPPEQYGEPRREDGSDGFQFYENGGATACFSYFTIKALYHLGRAEDARRIFLPMMDGFAAGNFQGFDASGRSKDWRDWNGGGHGYEGMLVDNYFTLLAMLDEAGAAKQ